MSAHDFLGYAAVDGAGPRGTHRVQGPVGATGPTGYMGVDDTGVVTQNKNNLLTLISDIVLVHMDSCYMDSDPCKRPVLILTKRATVKIVVYSTCYILHYYDIKTTFRISDLNDLVNTASEIVKVESYHPLESKMDTILEKLDMLIYHPDGHHVQKIKEHFNELRDSYPT